MTKSDTHSEIVSSCKPAAETKVVKGLDDIIRFTIYKSTGMVLTLILLAIP
jgi:hypothetical protein